MLVCHSVIHFSHRDVQFLSVFFQVLEKEIKEKRTRMIELSQAPGDEVDGEKLAEERRIVEER